MKKAITVLIILMGLAMTGCLVEDNSAQESHVDYVTEDLGCLELAGNRLQEGEMDTKYVWGGVFFSSKESACLYFTHEAIDELRLVNLRLPIETAPEDMIDLMPWQLQMFKKYR